MTSVTPEVAEIRERLAARGVQLRPETDPVMITRVLDRVGGDVDLAVDALALEPRPGWLRDLVGSDLMRVTPAGAP